jgi:gluconate kinase
MIYWFIGQPGSGKTTLAKKLKAWHDAMHIPAIHLDGDDLRNIFKIEYKPENFTKEYSHTNTRQLQRMAEHINKQGVNVIISTVNSTRSVREELKLRTRFIMEIYVVNSGKHIREELNRADYEPPLDNFIFVNTKDCSEEESFKQVLNSISNSEEESFKKVLDRIAKKINL